MAYKKDEDELDSEREQAQLRKKKKKKFPFYGKAFGGVARRRPDRKAYRKGGVVASKADADLISPNEPNAPAGGRVAQKFQDGGGISSVRRKPVPGERREPPPFTGSTEGLRHGGVAKRQEGGQVDDKDKREDGEEDDEGVPEYKRGGYAKGGVLSAKQRQSLPSSSFALPGKGKGPKGAGAGSYPIPDIGHAKSALSRGAAHASPAELATIKRKVKAKFPSMKVS